MRRYYEVILFEFLLDLFLLVWIYLFYSFSTIKFHRLAHPRNWAFIRKIFAILPLCPYQEKRQYIRIGNDYRIESFASRTNPSFRPIVGNGLPCQKLFFEEVAIQLGVSGSFLKAFGVSSCSPIVFLLRLGSLLWISWCCRCGGCYRVRYRWCSCFDRWIAYWDMSRRGAG